MKAKLKKPAAFVLAMLMAGSVSLHAQKVTFAGERVTMKQAFEYASQQR